jgi:hypothetical protein
MIDHLDNLLRQLLMARIDEITDEAQVRFEPPDDAWRTYVSNLVVSGNPANALNVYLVDLRENQKLRSNERVRDVQNGIVSETPAPRRVDCHYLITAWSPATPAPAIEPTIDEHALLYTAAVALTNSEPLVPRKVYEPDPLPATFPQVIADAELPTRVLPAEGFAKLAEFWGTMGVNHRWKPGIYLIVTLPIVLEKEIAGPMVTTRITEYRHSGRPLTAEVLIEIGGHVLTGAAPLSVATGNATVTALGGGGTIVTVNNPAPFRAGDIITETNTTRARIRQIAANILTLDAALAGLAIGSPLSIANLTPQQTTIRLTDVTGLGADQMALITGDDAANPGMTATERALVLDVNTNTRFVTFSPTPARVITFDLQVVNVPALIPLNATAGAWVRLEETGGTPLQTTTTDVNGRFKFGQLSEGNYILRVRALGFAEATRNIQVPSPTGEYDVQLI